MTTTHSRRRAGLASLLALVLVAAAALALMVPAGVAAQAAPDPVGIGALFNLGMGARALGMGGAFVAVADDGTAIYYNPAGLAFVEDNNFTALFSNAFGAGSYLGLGYARPNLGASIVGLVSSVDETDGYGNVIGTLGYQEGALALGGAYAFGPFAVGGAAKGYIQNAPENLGYGFTCDVGLMLSVPDLIGLRAGAVGRNLLGSVTFESQHVDEFERDFLVGVSIRPIKKLLVAADFDMTAQVAKVGAEYQIVPAVALRGGVNINPEVAVGFSAGVGFALGGFTLDYAYQFHPSELPDSHWLSLGFSF